MGRRRAKSGTPRQASPPDRTAEPSRLSAPAPWIVLGLIAITVAVFAPVRHFGFVPWDDPHYVYENAHVLRGLSWENVRWAFTEGSPYWHPLTWLSLMFDVTVFGVSPGAMHMMAVAMHCANAVLLFLFFFRVTGAPWRSAFVAAVFAVHPMRVESVAWIAERKDVLPTLCMMTMLHAYVWYVRRPSVRRYLLVTVLLALGLLAKPILITLPFGLLLLDLWPLNRAPGLADAEGGGAPGMRRAAARLIVEKLPWLALALAAVALNLTLQAQPIATFETVPLSLRFANALTFYVRYILALLWPAWLSPLHPLPRVMPAWWVMAGAAALLAAVTVMALRSAVRRPYVTMGWLWYLSTLVPVIGLVQAGDQGMADRFGYIPFIGLYAIVAWGLPDLARRWSAARIVLPVAAGLVIVAAAVSARAYVWDWRDGAALWQRAVDSDPSNHRAHANLGEVLADDRRFPAAEDEFREAIRLAPQVSEYRRRLATVLARSGRLDEALVEFNALLDGPSDGTTRSGGFLNASQDRVRTLIDMGLVLAQAGRYGEAVAAYEEAVRLDPSSAIPHANLCLALAGLGRIDEGMGECREALRIDPDLVEGHSNLGALALSKGDLSQAVGELTLALRLDPQPPPDRYLKLGAALVRQGRLDDARRAFVDALRLDPGDAEAHNALGAALSDLGRTREAIGEFNKALELRPNLAHVYGNRGRARAIEGDLAGAIRDYETLLALDPGNAGARSAIENLKKLGAPR